MSAPTRTQAAVGPLLDLLRTTLAERGEVTFRLLAPEEVDGSWNPVVEPRALTVGLPDDQDDVRYLTTIVYGLFMLGVVDCDLAVSESSYEFCQDATRRTLAAMGETAR